MDSNEFAELVVNSVKGDASFGENSALYASFGYSAKTIAKQLRPAPRTTWWRLLRN
jgi:hypothetical protein